jgi:cell division FtsZ-interacting protein ZapD
MQHKDHFNKCNPLNQKGISEFFRRNIANVLSLNQRIAALYDKVNQITSKEETLSSLEFMNTATEMMNLADLEQVYKNFIKEEKKESEYEWLYTEPILM